VVARHAGGDHDIFIAEATACDVHEGAPLVFYKGRYGDPAQGF
jgi:flavin reductase (DIM6/NTAB) family NADH-FMN oxidoreductase RutF